MQKPQGQYAPEGSDAETQSEAQPGSRGLVLRNRLDIVRKQEMDRR